MYSKPISKTDTSAIIQIGVNELEVLSSTLLKQTVFQLMLLITGKYFEGVQNTAGNLSGLQGLMSKCPLESSL